MADEPYGLRNMDINDRAIFLNMAAVFEVALVGLAFFMGWLIGEYPLAHVRLEWSAVAYGLLASIPLFALFLLLNRIALGPLARIRRLLVEMLGPPLSACRWYDLALLSILVGFSEELLFRGVIQPWFEQAGNSIGLIGSNVVFGLAHSVTATYAVVAGLIGIYLGLLMDVDGSRNLLTPMITHAVYDYLAFVVIVRTYRREAGDEPDEEQSMW